ncbi:murein biosynthesis integral membrane protein MurJ [Oligoflexia bacterium]|nr:murein biosynthesis integral membrane protein MurJ [Oligoflexia bacterium]
MEQTETSHSVIRGTSIVSSLTVLSRGLGFIRDLLLARLFGAGIIADAFFVAFRIPNILRSLVAEGALTSAFVPVFSTELKKSRADAQTAMHSVTGLLLATTIFLALAGIIFAQELVTLFAPGFGQGSDKSMLCATLLRIMMPFVVCVSLVAMLNGALNTVKVFGAAAFAQVAMNLALITGALLASLAANEQSAYVVASFVLIGGALQILVQIPALRRAHLTLMPSLKIFTPVTKQLLFLMFPAIIGAAVYQLSMFMNTVLASVLVSGSVAWLFYADRLVQLPIGIFSVALASVLLPTLARAVAEKKDEIFSDSLVNALRYTSFVTIPIAFGFFYFAEQFIVLIFERGAFTHHASLKTALALKAGAIGIWGVSCHSMVARAFIARKDTKTPTAVGVFSLVVSLTCALLFMGAPVAGQDSWLFDIIIGAQAILSDHLFSTDLGHAGLALATSIASTTAFFVLALLIQRRLKTIKWDAFFIATLKSLAAALGMLLCLSAATSYVTRPFFQLLIGIPTGIVSFSVFSLLLKNREIHETILTLRRILR